MNIKQFSIIVLALFYSCNPAIKNADPLSESLPFTWNNATIYFLMTDRFYNGDKSNDYQHSADNPPAPYRGYMGGDIKGITQKIRDGYFSDLGVNAIWMTPLVEQIKNAVDEGTGNSFGFHGYWTRDWTALDSKFGTIEELKELVRVAHDHKIRVLMDIVANHTGPVTAEDKQWPDSWVKTGPQCTYTDFESTVNCTLVKNLPDIRTESEEEVSLPPFLIEKWKKEGRYDTEVAELDAWFSTTGYTRAPVNYILKWLVDFIKEYGVDGFRVDTVKHTESYVWSNLYAEAVKAWETYKKTNPEAIIAEETPFYMVGEVYNYYASAGRDFDYGDQKADFFKDGFDALINFDFKSDAKGDYESIFTKYDKLLNGSLKGKTVLNYVSSHDDGGPYDLNREHPIEAGTKLLLSPGGAQIYYGDESSRSLTVEAKGDATLRSFMNWDEIQGDVQKTGATTREILAHWQKLGRFRAAHPAIGAGRHSMISDSPYTFSRTWTKGKHLDQVVIALDLKPGKKSIKTGKIFLDGTKVKDAYSNETYEVKNRSVEIDSPYGFVLLEKI